MDQHGNHLSICYTAVDSSIRRCCYMAEQSKRTGNERLYVIRQSATFTVELTSTCVIVTEWYIFTADGYYSYYSVAPNPVNSDLTIYVDDEKLKTKKIKRLPSRVFKR
jgi:hypothetical protein